AAARAFEAGVGSTIAIPVGGALDPKRFPPLEMEVTVDMLSRGRFLFESWGNWVNSGNTAVLKTSNVTVVANSQPIHLFDRSLFLAHGQDPRNFDLVVVKSPHCQHRFFDAWAAKNFNIDFPGATSANLPRLGHTICQRPMYPLDDGVTFTPRAKVFD
ncbi:MAG: MlrC C-terminal domain-containing protein, partial [Planctomycetes bacterium]|nr:MlrC C-terminal domain-containing protein [Planctomycetota bacterium]